MLESQVIPGEYYQIAAEHISSTKSGDLYKVFKRNNDPNYPFEITAAHFGIKAEDIRPVTDKVSLKLIKLLQSL
jgi:hypothetical protein